MRCDSMTHHTKPEEVSMQDLLSGKVRLEFGNLGQLTAIKRYERDKEAHDKMCKACDGEGSIICERCGGTGEIS